MTRGHSLATPQHAGWSPTQNEAADLQARYDKVASGDRSKTGPFTMPAIVILALLGSLAAGFAWKISHSAAAVAKVPGQLVADFAIRDVRTGQLHRRSDHDGRLITIVFIGTACPTSERAFPGLNWLAKKYENREVDFLAINSNASETPTAVAEQARRLKILFPVLKDTENRVADSMAVEQNCEVILLDRQRAYSLPRCDRRPARAGFKPR